MNLEELRAEIDTIDDSLLQDFAQRMNVVGQIGLEKKSEGLPTLDPAREREKLADIVAKLPPEMEQYGYTLWSMLFEISRSYQSSLNPQPSALRKDIERAIADTQPLFPPAATVACQGVGGAYSQLACEELFKHPQVMYFKTFESVFSAIENGFCDYAVLPLENSTAGSVKEIYDLMLSHSSFKIVRSTRLKVDHNLVAKKGTKMSDIKEIFSHPQAISQCAKFLDAMPGVKITACENTAAAAEAVAKSERTDVAAISSYNCVELYGLERLAADIQDRSNNYTRFICIAAKPEVYPGADRTSLLVTLANEPGSLYQVLARIYGCGINLTKLESRPIPGSDDTFRFYFDLEASVYSPELPKLLGELESVCEHVCYLGSYSETV